MIESLFSNRNYAAAKELLDAATIRHEALSANIANLETPGYQRVDLPREFAAEFAARFRNGEVGGAASAAASPAPLAIEDPHATPQRKDGNNVELDKELLALSKNSAEYDALTEFVSGSIKQLRLAITGRSQ